MEKIVTYEFDGAVATITMNDGKANTLSPRMFIELNEALDRAEADKAVVLLTAPGKIFSAGFELSVLNAGGDVALGMLRSGFELSARLLSFPSPVVIASHGHVIAMGIFVMLSGDYRIGATGAFKYTANEVAIGMTMPHTAIEICRQRLTPAALTRAVILAEVFTPDSAVSAGFLDRVVPVEDVLPAAREVAAGLASLDRRAHTRTKLRLRSDSLAAIRAAIEVDDAENRSFLG